MSRVLASKSKHSSTEKLNLIKEIARNSNSNVNEQLQFFFNKAVNTRNTGGIWTKIGHCYLIKNDINMSWDAYKHACAETSPSRDPSLSFGLGVLYFKMGIYSKAQENLFQTLKLNPYFPEKQFVLYKLGVCHKANGNLKKAQQLFKSCFKIDMKSECASFAACQLGSIFEHRGKINKATTKYKLGVTVQVSPETIACLSWGLFKKNYVQESIMLLDTAIRETDLTVLQLAELNYLLSRCYASLKNYTASLEALRKCLKEVPNSYVYWVSAGVVYSDSNDLNNAFQCFSKAILYGEGRSELWYNLGILYERSTQRDEAIISYQHIFNKNDPVFLLAAERLRNLGTNSSIPDCIHPQIDITSMPIFTGSFPSLPSLVQSSPLKPLGKTPFEEILKYQMPFVPLTESPQLEEFQEGAELLAHLAQAPFG